MGNVLFGILALLFCFLFFREAWRSYTGNRYTRSLIWIVLAGLLLRVFISFDLYLHEWDERYHALVAKNLIADPFTPVLYPTPLLEYDYRDWSANHIWVHKQPVPLYSMALSMFLFGVNVLALRLPSVLLSTLAIVFTYKIGAFLFSRKTGLLAAFLCAIHGFLLELTAGRVATDHIDLFFFALITMAMYYALAFARDKRVYRNILCAVFTAAAILTKWLPALIVLPVWAIAQIHHNGKTNRAVWLHGLVLVSVILFISVPWQLYIHARFPLEAGWESEYNLRHFLEGLEPHGQPFYFHFDRMRILFGELIYLPLLWLLWVTVKKRDTYKYLILTVWILVPYLFFSVAQTKMQGYLMFTGVAFFILTAVFFTYLMRIRLRFKSPKAVFVLAGLFLLLPVRYSIERIKPFDVRPRTQAWIQKARDIARAADPDKTVVFNSRYPVEIMFYTDMLAYEKLPAPQKLEQLLAAGYAVYIDNAHAIPPEIRNMKQLRFEHLSAQDRKGSGTVR
ncbi:MAG: hypothetical protein EP344_12465 [Bacteroidetes bacterium]|nr:MAG: hypothetical protein EP344_12465 [Bacteroidota bacterium]